MPEHDPPTGSGFLSGVFSFVSRELEGFITTATGGTLSEIEEAQEQPYLHTKHNEDRGGPARAKRRHRGVKLHPQDKKTPPKHRFEAPSHVKRRTKHPSPSFEQNEEFYSAGPPATTAESVHQSRQYRESDDTRHSPSSPPSRPPSRSARLCSPHVEDPASEDSRSPSPPPITRTLRRRRPSISMPGSLYPRSPSLVPDGHGNNSHGRHVHFAEGIPNSQDQGLQDLSSGVEENAAGPSRRPSSKTSSVKAAVKRFNTGGPDADPSILLPSPHGSPARKENTRQNKGKARAVEAWDGGDDGHIFGEVRVRGKERELVAAREELRRRGDGEVKDAEEGEREKARDKDKIRALEEEIERLKQELLRRPTSTSFPYPPPPPPPPPPPVRIGSTDGTGIIPFSTARAALKHAPPPVEAPINPLPSGRRQGLPSVGIAPDMMAAFLNEMKTVRLRKVSGSMPLPAASSSRDVEGPTLSRRVSLPALQKVDGASSSSSLSFSLNGKRRDDAETRVGDKRKRGDHGELENFRGDLRAAVKRRSFASASSESSFASTSASTSSSSHSHSQSHPLSGLTKTLPPSSLTDGATPSLCSDNDVDREDDRLPSTPPLSTLPVPPFRNVFRFRETGIPVQVDPPSLGCEKGKEQEIIDVDMLSDDDDHKPRHSPPTVQSSSLAVPPATSSSSSSTRPMPPPSLPVTNTSPRTMHRNAASGDLFAKRPPTSPLPLQHSPRKPRPPRTSGSSRPFPPTPHPVCSRQPAKSLSSGDEEDPLSLRYSYSPEPERDVSFPALHTGKLHKQRRVQAPEASRERSPSSLFHSQLQPHSRSGKGRPSSGSSSSTKLKRRLTLDEELRDVHHFGFEGSGDENGEESAFFVGVGTRSKKHGFLAHGGAGGMPVFMGKGYVEDAEEDGMQSLHYGGRITDEAVKYEDDEHGHEYPARIMESRRPATETMTTATQRRGRR